MDWIRQARETNAYFIVEVFIMKGKRWQDWLNLLLGAWLFASPWALKYADNVPIAARNAWWLGAAIILVAALAIYLPRAWEEVVNFLLGAWGIVAPWALGFAAHQQAMTNTVVVGAAVAVLALWVAVRDKEFQKLWHPGQTA